MTVKVRMFARARDLAGRDAVTVVVPTGAKVGDLRRQHQSEARRLAHRHSTTVSITVLVAGSTSSMLTCAVICAAVF